MNEPPRPRLSADAFGDILLTARPPRLNQPRRGNVLTCADALNSHESYLNLGVAVYGIELYVQSIWVFYVQTFWIRSAFFQFLHNLRFVKVGEPEAEVINITGSLASRCGVNREMAEGTLLAICLGQAHP